MLKANILKITSLLILIVFISCSASVDQTIIYKDKITVIDLESWLNLMPGGPGSFHIAGKYQCNNFSNCTMELESIKILSGANILYELKSDDLKCDKQVDSKSGQIAYQFFNNPGLKINDEISMTEKIDVSLIFKSEDSLVEKIVKDVPLTRAY